MNADFEKFWASVPKKADHPSRVPILEVFRWIGEPLSAIGLVDVLDGRHITMWEAVHHLRVLEAFDVVEPVPAEAGQATSRREAFDVPYRLKAAAR
ncbi:MAG TPA: hypothetical protein VFI09_09020 [Solirubrobacterales bacterium]|nr:hypothetical protein [Solirubrobacterales bacterium]